MITYTLAVFAAGATVGGVSHRWYAKWRERRELERAWWLI